MPVSTTISLTVHAVHNRDEARKEAHAIATEFFGDCHFKCVYEGAELSNRQIINDGSPLFDVDYVYATEVEA